jgi:putative phosphoribosyl transferase
MPEQRQNRSRSLEVEISVNHVTVSGDLTVPDGARGIVIFAHGSGSSRFSPRNRYVADVLAEAGFVALLLDLLTSEEEQIDLRTGEFRFDIQLLADRLERATEWAGRYEATKDLAIGYFGASTGAAAALIAAAHRPEAVRAVVSRGGRPDLAGPELRRVLAPTLLIVGSLDPVVMDLNQEARQLIPGEVQVKEVAGATHLFEEPRTLEEVARLAREWFTKHLSRAEAGPG